MNMLTLNSKQIGKVVFKATVGYYIGKNIALFANSIINKLVIKQLRSSVIQLILLIIKQQQKILMILKWDFICNLKRLSAKCIGSFIFINYILRRFRLWN